MALWLRPLEPIGRSFTYAPPRIRCSYSSSVTLPLRCTSVTRRYSSSLHVEKEKMPEAVVDLFKTIRTQSLEKIDEFTPPNLLSLIWSFAAAQMLDRELSVAVGARLQTLAAEKDAETLETRRSLTPVDSEKLEILAEFDNFLSLAKPAGVQVNPPADAEARNYTTVELVPGSMQERVHDHLGPLFPICMNPTASYGLVHRLDMDTTGNLLVAKTWWGYYWLRLQWSSLNVLKEYVCLAHGHVAESMEIKDRIKVNRETGPSGRATSSAEVSEDGRPAFTEVDVLGRYTSDAGPFSLVKCRIHTGRTHQIRVHLRHKGFPLVTDVKYAPDHYEQDKLFCQRNFLHNCRICIDDVPDASGVSERRTLDAPLPGDLRDVLASLRPEDDASEVTRQSFLATGLQSTTT